MSEPFLSSSWHRVAHLRLRPRGQAQVRRHHYRGRPWYVLKDEVSGRIHQFNPAVYLFIGLMDGRRTIDELWVAVAAELGDDAPTQDEIIRLLSQLHAADLLQSNVSPDAEELFDRHANHSKAKLKQSLGGLLSIKIPLFDPDRFLERTAGAVRPFVGWFGALLWVAVVLPALVLAGIHWPELRSDITDQIVAGENLLAMAVAFLVLKTLHELGHGYAAKVSGAAVHEIGIMLLVFVPMPYVDASASAAFRSKWRRILVGAGGMLVEIFVASLALYVWILAEPGTVRSIAYSVMLIAGISTIVFNANPLLRFDGYYILCDLIEIPNLGQRANRYWLWLVDRRLFGAEVDRPNATPGERAWFIAYAPLAFVYRLSVVLGIALFVASRYLIAGVVIALWAVFSGLAWPLLKGIRHVVASPRLEQQRMRAIVLTFGTTAILVGGLLGIPVPFHTTAEGVLWLPDESIVRASANGFVRELAVRPGVRVTPGTILVETDEPDIASEIHVLRSEVDGATARLQSEQFSDRVEAGFTQEKLTVLRASLTRAEKRAGDLLIRSGAEGVFVVPHADDLPGRFLRRGEVVGYVKQDDARVVRVVVTQGNIDLVRTGLETIEVKLAERPTESWPAQLLREVPAGSERLPSKAFTGAGGGLFAADPSDPDQIKSLERTFQFDLALPSGAAPGHYGSRVYVRFAHEPEPLASQWYRRLRQLFLARLGA